MTVIPPKALIASDLDDTLQPRSTGTIDPRFFEEIPKLARRGVYFTIASGRNYASLKKCLAPIAEEIFFICENGAEIYQGSRLLNRSTIARGLGQQIVQSIVSRSDCFVRINADENFYIADEAAVLAMGVPMGRVITTFDEVVGEIRQITAACPADNRQALAELRPMWEEKIEIAVNGPHWIDFTPKGKGRSVEWLCHYLGLDTKQVYAFGDNFSDLSMLKMAGHPYLMEIAPEAMKKQFSDHAHSVIETIHRLESSGIL